MADVTVNTAVGKQSQQMEGRIVLLYVIYGSVQSLIFKKAVVFYGFSDSGQLLIDDSPGADIEMSDFQSGIHLLKNLSAQTDSDRFRYAPASIDYIKIFAIMKR